MERFFRQAVTGLFFFGLLSGLHAYSDADLDGVEDSSDRCPQSSMEDLVDASGCVPKTGLSLTLGATRSSGNYGGTETIVSNSADFQLTYTKGSWYASIVSSYLESGVDQPVTKVQKSSGMGDTYLGLGYTAWMDGWSLGGQGVLKFPTADKDIGTGNNDIGGYVTLAKMAGSMTYFATAGYLVTGDDADVTYNDTSSLNVGLGKSFDEQLFSSLSAMYSDPLLDGLDPSRSLSLFIGYRFDRCWYLNASYIAGMSDSVADSSVSVMVGYSF